MSNPAQSLTHLSANTHLSSQYHTARECLLVEVDEADWRTTGNRTRVFTRYTEEWAAPDNDTTLWVIFEPSGWRLATDFEEIMARQRLGLPMPDYFEQFLDVMTISPFEVQ